MIVTEVMMGRIKRKRTDIPSALSGLDVKMILRRRGIYIKQRENRRLKEAALPIAKIIVENKHLKANNKKELPVPDIQRYSSMTNAQAEKYWEKTIHDVETIERHFDIALKKFIESVKAKALSNLQGIIDNNKSIKGQKAALNHYKKDIFDDQEEEDLQTQAEIDFTPLLQNMSIIAGQEAYKLIKVNEPYIQSDALRNKILANVRKFTGSMLDTDQQYLTDIIKNGIESGASIQEIQSTITDNFDQFSSMQSTRISRTEVLRASNQSALDAFDQSGLVEGKQWLTAGADDECADYEGQVEALDGNFYDDTTEFADGDPPLHPNCRCILIPVMLDEKGLLIDRTKEYRKRIKDLEAMIDKRTKAFRKLKDKQLDDQAYIKALEKYLDE